MNKKIVLIIDPETERVMEIARLIAATINGNLTTEEFKKLENWLDEGDVNKEIFQQLTDPKVLNRLYQEKYN